MRLRAASQRLRMRVVLIGMRQSALRVPGTRDENLRIRVEIAVGPAVRRFHF
jgi:hypothetical protein